MHGLFGWPKMMCSSFLERIHFAFCLLECLNVIYLIWQCVQDLLTYFSTSAILQCPGSSTTHAATGISGSRRTSRKRLGRCCTWLGLKAIANIGDVDTDNLKELQGLNRCDGHVQQAEIQQPFNKLSLAECSCSIHIQILEELFPAVSANCLQDFGRQYINRHMPKPEPLPYHDAAVESA